MWDYIQDDLTSVVFVSKKDKSLTIKIYGFEDNDLTSVVFVSKKDKSLTIKIYGFEDNETAETFAHYTMSLLNFDYNTTGYSMPSKMIH